MSQAVLCPVCLGKGLVPNGFYMAVGTNNYTTSSMTPETCRSCGGYGYLILPGSGNCNVKILESEDE